MEERGRDEMRTRSPRVGMTMIAAAAALLSVARSGSVPSSEVPAPRAARVGWHETAEPNLVNGQGLPASLFRTRPLKGGVRVEEVEWGAR